MRKHALLWLLGMLILSIGVLAIACGDDDDSDGENSGTPGGGFQVVATTTQIADMAQNVAGDRVKITPIVGPNQDPHEFEISPSGAKAVANADLVLRHGMKLDSYLDKTLSSAKRAKVVTVTDGVRVLETADGPDPHVWFSVANARTMVGNIRDAMIAGDAKNADAYRQNATRYLADLDQLEKYVRSETGRVPSQCRKLVTDHDVLRYYAAEYDFEVLATVIPGSSTDKQPSAQDIARVVQAIRAAGVPAIFPEASANTSVLEQIAREANVKIAPSLYADSLGPAGSGGGTYIEMMRTNTNIIVSALESCRR